MSATQAEERIEREAQREAEIEAREAADRVAQRKHELELKKLEVSTQRDRGTQDVVRTKAPKFPVFVEGKDELDSYLLRFELFATQNEWPKETWATALSTILTGTALGVHSRLSDKSALDYDQVKNSLLKRLNLSEDGYRAKFRDAKPEAGESPEQYIVRLKNYLHK